MRNSFGIGDIVTLSTKKDAVRYEIIEETERSVYTLKSAKSTRRNVPSDKLTLVEIATPAPIEVEETKGGSETGGNPNTTDTTVKALEDMAERGGPTCKDVDGRETPYGLMILGALLRKPYVHLAVNNPMKPSNRKRNRARIKRERTTWHTRNAMANRAA